MQAPTEQLSKALTDRPPIKDEDWAKWLLEVVEHFEMADQPIRDRQLRKWRKQMLYWDHIQYVWWSEVAHAWRTAEQASTEFSGDNKFEIDPTLYAKVVNIYRAHGEVVIAAMSSQIPRVIFPPADADNPDDVLTSKSYSKLAELIYKHNYAELLLMKALFLLYNQGLVFGYNENYESEEFGQVKVPINGKVKVRITEEICPNCLQVLGSHKEDVPQSPEDDLAGEVFEDGEENVLPANIPPPQQGLPVPCPGCQQMVVPESQSIEDEEDRTVAHDQIDKCREILSVWGPLNVKIPAWIKDQNATPYLSLETEEHYAYLQELYPEIAEFIDSTDSSESYDRLMRTPTSYEGDSARDLTLCRRVWLRPWTFNVLGVKDTTNLEKVETLKGMFPDGVYVVIIGSDMVAEAVPDKLDDHWTVSIHPLSDAIHAEPIGAPLMPVQEMVNELANLTLESIEHQIPELYADTDAIDFDSYSESEARPGMTYPATKRPGESLSNSFYEVKGGSLSKEVDAFSQWLEKSGQFVLGSLPSVFGGAIEGGSNTAREYELSRAQALQRLGTTWKLVTTWWTRWMAKAVRSYAANMIGDEKYVENRGSGNFVNVWVRQAQMQGTIGEVFPEASETLPINWNQKRDILLNLINMKDEMVMQVISHPENTSLVARLIGLSELYIPGDDDRNKQLKEIGFLILGAPQEVVDEMAPPTVDPMTGMAQPAIKEVSSVPIEPDLDNHEVEAEVCKAWLKSEVGQEMKARMPAAYLNVLLHMKEHLVQSMQEQMALEQQEQKKAMLGSGKGEIGPSKQEKRDKDLEPVVG